MAEPPALHTTLYHCRSPCALGQVTPGKLPVPTTECGMPERKIAGEETAMSTKERSPGLDGFKVNPLGTHFLHFCRVGHWRAHFRVRWQFHAFQSGPQSGSHGHVSSRPLKFRTAGFPQYGFKFQAPLSSAESLPMSVDGLSGIPTYATFPHNWLSPSESPRPEGIPPQCAGLQRLTTPPGPRGPRSGEFFMASPSSLADLIRQSGFLRSISQQSRL